MGPALVLAGGARVYGRAGERMLKLDCGSLDAENAGALGAIERLE